MFTAGKNVTPVWTCFFAVQGNVISNNSDVLPELKRLVALS